ncbi:MAG: sugar phosphate isomerase/epimerase family protein [Planctomycetales bacterium]
MPPPPVIACHTTCYGPFGGAVAIEQTRAAGLEWIELPIRTAGVGTRWGDEPLVSSESSLAELASVERLLVGYGVQVATCTCLAGNPLHPDQLQLAKRKLDLAAHFGVAVAIVNGGAAENGVELENLLVAIRELGDHADTLGITACLEMQRGTCVNHREMLHFLAQVDHPRIRGNFDTGNLLYYNENVHPEVALAKSCHRIKHVRLKDSMGEPGRWYAPALGRGGAVDFLRTFQIMRDCGFRGPYSIATDGIAGEPDLTLEERQQRVVESVRYLRSLGYFD